MQTRLSLGKKGELCASEFLFRQGYEIIARNYRCQWGEIDIIAKQKNEISFVEVKTRRSIRFGTPAAAVTKTKQAKIHYTAWTFLREFQLQYKHCWFDVIEIFVEKDKAKIHHIKHCF